MKKQQAVLSEALKQEFEKDIELFEYFLVLLNSSSPIRNVELMWADDLELPDPGQQTSVKTEDALVQLQPAGAYAPGRSSPSPSTLFCDLVHGFGTHEEQTCARSDKPAKARCCATGRTQVYPCHVGLTDIAVPVICEERYLGTLFSGQVLTEAPTAEGFARVRDALAGQAHIDLARLEEAYFRVPVVTTAQVAEMVQILEVFARYLANAWKRLGMMGELQQIREREMALDRRELIEKLLSGQVGSEACSLDSLRALARNLGLQRFPDRVLLLRLQDSVERAPAEAAPPRAPDRMLPEALDSQLKMARIAQVIEDRCKSWPNTLTRVISPGEICIFTSQRSRISSQERLLLDEMAQMLLRIARSHGLIGARVGISGQHREPAELLTAYHEAMSALRAGHSTLNWFEAMPERQQDPTQAFDRVLKALHAGDAATMSAVLREFLSAAAPAGGAAHLEQARGLLTWACEHLTREVVDLGADAQSIRAARERAVQIIMASPSSFAMAETFRNLAEQLRLQVVQLFSQREEKIVTEIQRMIRETGPEKVTVHTLAKEMKLSAGHLGRVYSRTTGHTLEEYLIRQKLEMGKRLLLDPRLHVAEVAYQCGFCNPAYFASVFKKYMHCTPRAYAKQPQRWSTSESVQLGVLM
ncbi:MAG: PocR ligand-binding domain-containing protein [Acidobacteriaceae bacterium]